ncbi:TPA: hypothetical protein ACH3X3_006399 [Trebouxia sp. C0006]
MPSRTAQSSSGNYAGRILGNSGRQPSQAWGQNRQRRELVAGNAAMVCRKNHGQTRLPAYLEVVKAPSRKKQSQLHLVQPHNQQSMLPRQAR